MMYNTLYGEIQQDIADRMAKIKLLVCDVDGVFSDGRIYLGNNGEELKAFNTKDGYGVRALVDSGVHVAIITGRKSTLVENRMKSLGVNQIVQGVVDKLPAFNAIQKELGLSDDETAFIGDDMPDHPCIRQAGLGVAVSDAHPLVLGIADFITTHRGGFGAVRELTDTIMQCQNTLHGVQAGSV